MRTKLIVLSLLILFNSNSLVFSQVEGIKKLFETAIKAKSSQFIGEIDFHKAQLFFLEKKWDSSLVYSMKQLSVKKNTEALNDYCHFFRGFSFKQKKLFTEAQKEFSNIPEKFEFHNRVSITLGEIALEQSEFKKAIGYFEPFENISDANYFGIEKSVLYHNIGLCYLHLTEYKKAEIYLLRSARLQEMQADTLVLIGAYGDIATLYYEQYQDNKAIPYFQKAYQLSKKIKDISLKATAAQNMAVVEENRKNFPLALTYRKEYEQWNDSLNDQNKVWAVADAEKKFAVKEKEKEVTVLQTENKLKIAERNAFVFASLLLAAILLISIYFYTQRAKRNKLLAAQKMQEAEIAHQKDLLQSVITSQEAERKRIGMDLHDEVGAALSTLRIKIEQHAGEAATAPAVTENYKVDIDKIIANMRNISHALSPRIAGSFGFYDAVHELADGVNRSGAINMQIQFDENKLPVFANEQAPMALYRVITELVNNTLKHAKAQNIQLTVAVADDTMSMAYSDDGMGIAANPGTTARGMGMQNIESRLGIIGATWAVQEPETGGYGVAITVPLK